jgi:hypothetical protein
MATSIEMENQIGPLLERVKGAVRTEALNAEIGRTVVGRLQRHFFELDASRPNALGGKRTHFYAEAAKGTQYHAGVDEVRVSVNALGLRQRLEGGTIRPVRAKYLTIPVIAEAYGHRAREFQNLHVIYDRSHKPVALAEAPQTTVTRDRRKGAKGFRPVQERPIGRVFFLLVKSVQQQADRSVIPSDEELQRTAAQAANNFFGRLARRSGGGS